MGTSNTVTSPWRARIASWWTSWVPSTRCPAPNTRDINRGGIRSVRSSQYSENVVRVVFVLDQKLGYTIMTDPKGLRISLQNPSGDFEPWSTATKSTDTFARAVPLGPATANAKQAQSAPQERSQARRISVTWTEAPINDVLMAFAAFSGVSIVPGSNVTGFVTADINDQPWDVALSTILSGQGLHAEEDEYGIIRVDNISDLNDREAIEPILTQAHRISFATATELQAAMQPLLSERGQVTVGTGTNTLIVSDIARVQDQITQPAAGARRRDAAGLDLRRRSSSSTVRPSTRSASRTS